MHNILIVCEQLLSTRVHEIRRTCPANFGNVRQRAVFKFKQMSGEKLQMSGEAQNNFAYSVIDKSLQRSFSSDILCIFSSVAQLCKKTEY